MLMLFHPYLLLVMMEVSSSSVKLELSYDSSTGPEEMLFFRSHEIDTTTKYNLKNTYNGFNVDTTLSDYSSTITSEKDIKLSW